MHWTPLRTMESVTILAGPISEKATEVRVVVPFFKALARSLPFGRERAPTEADWIYSPAARVIKRGQYYFPEIKPGAQQAEESLPLR